MKGLAVDVFDRKGDQGIRSFNVIGDRTQLIVVGETIPEIFESDVNMPAVEIIRRQIGGREYIHAEPVDKIGNYMFGGTFIFSSDSRFRELINDYPVPLHDRVEP